MQNAAGAGALVDSDDRNDGYRAIVADLVSLIGHVQASMRLIESAIATESPRGNQEIAANVVELDDVTPRYARASAALTACNAHIGVALHFLRDTRSSKPRSGEPAECARQPARSIGRA
jgi:hypothetical protein